MDQRHLIPRTLSQTYDASSQRRADCTHDSPPPARGPLKLAWAPESDLGASTRSGPEIGNGRAFQKRIIIILCEAAVILALLAAWLLVELVRSGRSLVVLFFYSFPSEFLVGLVPHEPVLIYWGGFHPAWIVALVSVVSTVMAEGVNVLGHSAS